MNRILKRSLLVAMSLAVLVLVGFWTIGPAGRPSVHFRSVPVKRGDLVATIAATGTVEPEEVVDVGAQVAGRILSFGKDLAGRSVDYGSSVEEGTILARIDDALYSADVAQAGAQLEQARAGALRAEADLGQLQAKLFQAERDWKRAQKLGPSDALSQSDFDAAQSANDVARANLAVGKAALVQAASAVAQAEATLRKAQQNLDYCTIKSPVKGVIIDRRVNIGQTVVASLNAPSLFLIAKDLKRMQVWVAVNEADIGSIHPGQPVTFTVDAYPGETFQGEVGKVRLNASMTQNVVTYTVEVLTDNATGKLLPYLTANLKFLLDSRNGVLLVPNAALRWIPLPEQVAPGYRETPAKGSKRPGPSGEDGRQESSQRVVWIQEGSYVRPVSVRVGLSDGTTSEVQGDHLKEEMAVVVGHETKDDARPQTASSPFTPQFPGRR